MKERCSPACNSKQYPLYYGKGIRVCEEWKNDFQAFYNWAKQNGYSDGLSIDRINSDGNYEPSNCRWIPKESQSNNRITSRYLTTKSGQAKTMADWARYLEMNYGTLQSKIKRGKTIDEVLEEKGR